MSSERPHTGDRTVMVSGDPTVAIEAWVISPEIQFEKGENYSIKISYRTDTDSGAACFIGVADTPSPTDLGQNFLWNISSVDNIVYNEVDINYTHLSDRTKYVGLVVVSRGGLSTQNIFDSFSIEKKTLSNQEFQNDFVSIVPNPISDFFVVKLKKTTNNVSIAIFNSLGKLIRKEKNVTSNRLINVSNISSGLYFAKVEDTNGRSLIKKIIIK